MAATKVLTERALELERQISELTVRALKGPFKRLTLPLPANSRTRSRIIKLGVHMFSFCDFAQSTTGKGEDL